MIKKVLLFVLGILAIAPVAIAQNNFDGEEPIRVIAIFAHPDDGDVKMGGTAALLAEEGYAVKFLSLTNGDAGHFEEGGGALAKRRRAEAKEAGERLGIDEYKVLDNHDGELMPELHIRKQVIREIRDWNADVVIGLRPNDYHPDHRNAGKLVQDAAYMVVVPNVAPDTPPLKKNPLFLYMQDRFEKPNPFSHDIVVGIDDKIDEKINAIDAHESQVYEWLPWVSGNLEDVPKSDSERKEWLRERWVNSNISESQKEGLAKWYSSEKAKSFNHAESFEVCEYGYQPSDEEIRTIFPMFN